MIHPWMRCNKVIKTLFKIINNQHIAYAPHPTIIPIFCTALFIYLFIYFFQEKSPDSLQEHLTNGLDSSKYMQLI